MTCDTKEKEFARRIGWELKSDWQLNKRTLMDGT
jgi:hypothetical protein